MERGIVNKVTIVGGISAKVSHLKMQEIISLIFGIIKLKDYCIFPCDHELCQWFSMKLVHSPAASAHICVVTAMKLSHKHHCIRL